MIQFEASNRWPTHLDAIERVKTAFYLRIAEVLQQQGWAARASLNFVDVIAEHFIAFRLVLFHEGELKLRQAAIDFPAHALKLSDPGKNRLLLRWMKQDLVEKPRLCIELKSFALQHPSFAATVRVVKAWLEAHRLALFLYDEIVELIVAYCFANPAVPALQAPASVLAGFCAVLDVLAGKDWAHEPLVADLRQNISEEEHKVIEERFKNKTTDLPVFIATKRDFDSMWTQCAVLDLGFSKKLWKRVVLLAKSTLKAIQTGLEQPCSKMFPWKTLFCASTKPFDLLVHLDTKFVPRQRFRVLKQKNNTTAKHKMLQTTKNVKTAPPPKGIQLEAERQLAIGFDPVLYLMNDLRSTLGHVADFFVDRLGSATICVQFHSGAGSSCRLALGQPASQQANKVSQWVLLII